MTVPLGRTDPTAIRETIDREIRSWLDRAPSTLADQALRPFDAVDDRFRGRFLVLGDQALPGRSDPDRTIPLAASVELLFGQAWLDERATGKSEQQDGEINRTRALLASDYLHALAYDGVSRAIEDPQRGEESYRLVAAASRRLTESWTRTSDTTDGSPDRVPIDPIVTATAGEVAALLNSADERYRTALRASGATLGLIRSGTPVDDATSILPSALVPEPLADVDGPADIDAGTVRDMLSPLPDSSGLSALHSMADSVVGSSERYR
jgi:hypothetical protein